MCLHSCIYQHPFFGVLQPSSGQGVNFKTALFESLDAELNAARSVVDRQCSTKPAGQVSNPAPSASEGNSPKLAQKTTREHMQRAQALIQKQKLEIQGDPSTNLCTHRPSSQNVYRLHDQNVEHLHRDTIALSTHTYTHQYSDTIAVFSRCVHTHLLSYIQSLQERTNLHSETIAAAIKSMINHICKGTRPLQSTQIFYFNVFPMRHCLSSLVETRLCLSSLVETRICLSPLVETRHCLSSSIKIACTIPSQPTNCTIIISSESKPASKQLHT